MPTSEDVARVALALPGAEEGARRHGRSWTVGGKAFAWERPSPGPTASGSATRSPRRGRSSPSPAKTWGTRAPSWRRAGGGFFGVAHSDGYLAYLVALEQVGEDDLVTALQDG
ncbi:hypothetical protein [Kineococcus sp. SYSU DK003]|uniref:hypothetical protein n=1 Tax=Kineococcus sp. SYSU DK003 TaxID=3383124 RepID=UPI003D7E9625